MKLRATFLLSLAVLAVSCGDPPEGSYAGQVGEVGLRVDLRPGGKARQEGFGGRELEGIWRSDEILGEKALLLDFEVEGTKPYTLRFDLRPESEGLRVARILVRKAGARRFFPAWAPLDGEPYPHLRRTK